MIISLSLQIIKRKSNKKIIIIVLKIIKTMDLMSSGNRRCLFSDYRQPNNRSTSLNSRAPEQQQHQQHSINKINQKAFIARIRDYINCCDDRIMEPCEKRNKIASNNINMMMRWKNVLVFSVVVVLMNLASINCVAARQIEGELHISIN